MADTPAEPLTREAALRKAYSLATKRLREAHQDEFNGLYTAEAKKLGHEWTPRPSDEQKAVEELDTILAKFPHLKERLVGPESGEQGGGEV
jgi:hypothetical protein